MFYLVIAYCAFFVSGLFCIQQTDSSKTAESSCRLIKRIPHDYSTVGTDYTLIGTPRLKIYTSSSGWSLRSIFFGMPELRLSFKDQDDAFLKYKTKKPLKKFEDAKNVSCSVDVEYDLYQKDNKNESLFAVELEQTWYNNWVICMDEIKYKNEYFYHYAFNGPINYKMITCELVCLAFLLAAVPCLYFSRQALYDNCVACIPCLIDEFNRSKE